MDPMLGMIIQWPGTFAPLNWMYCQGQMLQIQQYMALYSIIGTVYGGDGQTTFKLPDLSNRMPMGTSNGTTGLGQVGGNLNSTLTGTGTTSVALTVNNMPSHTHAATFTGTGSGSGAPTTVTIYASNDAATSSAPPSGGNGYLALAKAAGSNQPMIYSTTASTTVALNSATATLSGGGGGITGGTVTNSNTGGGQPVSINMPLSVSGPTVSPFLKLNFLIAVNGLYPDRP